MLKVLHCSPNEELRNLRCAILAVSGCYVIPASSRDEALREIQNRDIDVLVVCWQMGMDDGNFLYQEFRRLHPHGRIVLIEHHTYPPNGRVADRSVSPHDPHGLVAAVGGVPTMLKPPRPAV